MCIPLIKRFVAIVCINDLSVFLLVLVFLILSLNCCAYILSLDLEGEASDPMHVHDDDVLSRLCVTRTRYRYKRC